MNLNISVSVAIFVLSFMSTELYSQQIVDKLREASTSKELCELYIEIFQSEDSANRLIKSHIDGIALQAAWESCLNRIKISESEMSNEKNEVINWFLGWTEGRLRISLPEDWSQALVDCTFESRRELRFPYKIENYPYHYTIPEEVIVRKGDTLSKSGNIWNLTRDEKSFRLPDELLIEIDEYFIALIECCPLNNDRCLFVIQGPKLAPAKIYCSDQNGQLVWEKDLFCGSVFLYGIGGSGPEILLDYRHDIVVDETKSRVYVFGAGQRRVFIECFDIGSGDCLFRFSTAYTKDTEE